MDWQTHLKNLLLQTWDNVLQGLSTSTLAVVLFSVLVTFIIWFSINFYKWRRNKDMPPLKIFSSVVKWRPDAALHFMGFYASNPL
jgi:hypothetical protein